MGDWQKYAIVALVVAIVIGALTLRINVSEHKSEVVTVHSVQSGPLAVTVFWSSSVEGSYTFTNHIDKCYDKAIQIEEGNTLKVHWKRDYLFVVYFGLLKLPLRNHYVEDFEII